MITNDVQYRNTKTLLTQFIQAVVESAASTGPDYPVPGQTQPSQTEEERDAHPRWLGFLERSRFTWQPSLCRGPRSG